MRAFIPSDSGGVHPTMICQVIAAFM